MTSKEPVFTRLWLHCHACGEPVIKFIGKARPAKGTPPNKADWMVDQNDEKIPDCKCGAALIFHSPLLKERVDHATA